MNKDIIYLLTLAYGNADTMAETLRTFIRLGDDKQFNRAVAVLERLAFAEIQRSIAASDANSSKRKREIDAVYSEWSKWLGVSYTEYASEVGTDAVSKSTYHKNLRIVAARAYELKWRSRKR